MRRIVNILLIALMVLGAAAVYDMKYEAERAAEHVASLQRQVETEEASIARLRATWSYLTQPQQVQAIAERHQDVLGLAPLRTDQIATLADIPERPAPVPIDQGALEDILAGLTN